MTRAKSRSFRSVILIAVLAALPSALTGCASDVASEQASSGGHQAPNSEFGEVVESLEITTDTPSALAGTYRHGEATLRFETAQIDGIPHWALFTGSGEELFRVEKAGDIIVTTTLGAHRQRTDARVLAALKDGTLDSDSANASVTVEGDSTLVLQLRQMPEFAALPELSRALGERGYTGKAYPSTFALHLLGSQVSRERRQMVLEMAESAAVEPGAAQPQAFTPGTFVPQCYVSGSQTCCRFAANAAPQCVTTPTTTPARTCLEIYPPPDLRCDPNNDGCFGMCGPGCDECWDWLCGDCTYKPACAQHDWFCRQVDSASWYDWLYRPDLPIYAAQCYGGLSTFVAAVGCQF